MAKCSTIIDGKLRTIDLRVLFDEYRGTTWTTHDNNVFIGVATVVG